MACSPNAPKPTFSAPTSISRSRSTTSATPSSTFPAIARAHPGRRQAWSRWSGCSRISFRARSTSAAQFREAGVTVAVGGFHVSGCIAMLPELPPDLKEAQALGMILYAGEGEGRLADFLQRHPRRRAEAGLQLPQRHAGHGGGGDSRPAAPGRDPGRRALHELRRRPRLPVPVLASAPSSTCRGASRATAPPTTSRRSCAPTPPRT